MSREVTLVALAGRRRVPGLRRGWRSMAEISRDQRYAALYGPTDRRPDPAGRHRPAHRGDRGPLRRARAAGRRRGGLRRRQGDPRVDGPVASPPAPRAPRTWSSPAPSCSTTGAWSRPTSAIRDGRIVALGKAGNPDTMDGVTPELVIGPSTEIIAGNGHDPHRRRHRQPRAPDRAAADPGGAGGRHHHAHRRRHRPGRGHQGDHGHPGRVLAGRDAGARPPHWPVNVVLLGKGNTVSAEGLWEQLRAGAAGFKLHEDWGTTPAAIDACLTVAQARRGAGGDPHRHPQRGRLRRVDAGRDRRPADPHVPHRGRRRRARAGHHQGRRARRTCCRPRPTRPGRTPATRSTSTSTC